MVSYEFLGFRINSLTFWKSHRCKRIPKILIRIRFVHHFNDMIFLLFKIVNDLLKIVSIFLVTIKIIL